MNTYLFELKAQMRSFIVWTAAIVSALLVFMLGIYPVFYDSLEVVMKMISGFPPQFAEAFGFEMADLFSYGGFYSFTFTYIAVLGAIMATSIALSVFAREKRSKCTDFLLTKPRDRRSVFLAKLLSCLTMLAAANLLFSAASFMVYGALNHEGASAGAFLLAVSALLFTQLVFFSLGVFYAVAAKKVRTVSGIATAFGFAGFILSALVGILEEEAIRFIAPLEYFDPHAVFLTGGFETKYVLTAALVVLAGLAVSCLKYCKSDAHAV